MDFAFGQTTVVKHPVHAEIEITLGRLTEIEQMAHFQELSKYTVPTAVIRADTMEIVYDKGEVLVKELQNVPTTTFVSLLLKGIKSIKGMTHNGVDLPLDEKTIALFWRKSMNYTEPHPKAGQDIVDDNGTSTGKKYPATVQKQFWTKLVDTLLDDSSFDSDPLDATSV